MHIFQIPRKNTRDSADVHGLHVSDGGACAPDRGTMSCETDTRQGGDKAERRQNVDEPLARPRKPEKVCTLDSELAKQLKAFIFIFRPQPPCQDLSEGNEAEERARRGGEAAGRFLLLLLPLPELSRDGRYPTPGL